MRMKNRVETARSSNIELLRILCMLIIIMGHLCQGVIGGGKSMILIKHL